LGKPATGGQELVWLSDQRGAVAISGLPVVQSRLLVAAARLSIP